MYTPACLVCLQTEEVLPAAAGEQGDTFVIARLVKRKTIWKIRYTVAVFFRTTIPPFCVTRFIVQSFYYPLKQSFLMEWVYVFRFC